MIDPMTQFLQHPDTPPPTSQPPAPGPTTQTRKRLAAAFGILAIVLIGLNLRAGISSASALYHDLQ